MLKKTVSFLIVLMLMLTLVSCASEEKTLPSEGIVETADDSDDNEGDVLGEGDTEQTKAPVTQGEIGPTFTEDWPAHALPDGFPNLGKVTMVSDSRSYVSQITIYWNILSEDEVHSIVDKLNDYLDYDHAWQDYFYSDGLKYKAGTEEEILRVVIRYNSEASGRVDEEFEPQFYLEISGEGLPEKK